MRDDRADALRRQHARRDDELLDRLLGRLGLREIAEERRAAEVRERAPDVGLKQHDDREHHVAGQVANQPVDGLELRPARAVEQRDEHAAAERHLHGARAANELQDLVDEHRHHEDVDEVPPADRRRAGGRRSASSSMSSSRHGPGMSRMPSESPPRPAPPAPSRPRRARARCARRRARRPSPPRPCPSRARLAGRSPSASRMNDLRDGPTSIGRSSAAASSGSRASTP